MIARLFSILRLNPTIEIEEKAENDTSGLSSLDRQIARRLQVLRAGQGWTLEVLAARTGISRASLSRLERGELSPTATMLGALCAQYGWTISRLMAEAENGLPAVVRAQDQVIWKDPESGYVRRIVSPPNPHLKGELVEVTLPVGASITYDVSPLPGLEHHLWMLSGALRLEIQGTAYQLKKGDCVRYVLSGASRFECRGRRSVRYLISLVHP
ncbi:MAG TPA: XRE family transcriptional regulator [Bryobacteraceae bacterium]|nr:XRE family transcriptional regulator [Bryobacteraceae bacterium]